MSLISKLSLTHIIFLLFFVFNLQAQQSSTHKEIDYSIWAELLENHVSETGLVDYNGFINDKHKLLTFTECLSENTPQDNWTTNQKKAYLINAYNAFTIQLILEYYPIKSIKNIGDEPFDAFKMKFITYGSKTVSLDDIEKNMLLAMGDARIHFAVNCASFSCPKLDNKVYRPEDLDSHLNEATKTFINSELNKISPNKAKLSKLFNWYKNDFETQSQSVIDFINQYSNTKLEPNAVIEYLDYDWSLNAQ
jgi:hypothetical protein